MWENKHHILSAIKNLVFPKEYIEIIAQERLKICKACPLHSSNAKSKGYQTRRRDEHCTHCGCPLSTRTRALQKGCPINNWPAILSDEEAQELANIYKSANNDNNKEHSIEGSD